MGRGRDWGFWTEQKLQMLADYLPAFTQAAKNKAHGRTVYLDLFAGDTRNMSRTTGEEISGSPRVALDTSPEFTKVRLFELPRHAARLEAELTAEYPGRDLRVWAGDCNEQIDAALAELATFNRAPTFAFVDQYAAEIHWATLEKLAAFKRGSRYKVEMWLLFAPSMLPRGLAAEDPRVGAEFRTRIDAMFGSQAWTAIYDDRKAEYLSGADFRSEMVNLMRWRLENNLGYKNTHSFEMLNTRGVSLYTMLFATDNDAGNRIMSWIYRKAARRQPEMRAQAVAARQARKEEKEGCGGLFAPPPRVVPADARIEYVHTPPRPPYRRRARAS